MCEEYADIFSTDLPKELPPKRLGHEFKIDLEPDTKPVHRPIYNLSLLELDEAKKQIEYMLEHGFIQPSESPWGALVLFAPKKDGGLWFCIDYRWMNEKTIRNRYPSPLLEDIDVPWAKNPSPRTAQQRLVLVLKIVLYTVVVISEVLRLSTKSLCSRW